MVRKSAGCDIAGCDGAHITEGKCHHCDRAHKAKGLCKSCYAKSRRVYSQRTMPSSHTLTPDAVREIRDLYGTGRYRQAELGLKFGVTTKAISEAVNRKTWANVE